jgi:hypothetical protein
MDLIPWKGNNLVPKSPSKTTSLVHGRGQELMDAQETLQFNYLGFT